MQDLLIYQQLLLRMFVKNTKLQKLKTHKQNISSSAWWFSTWKLESDEKEKSLVIDDFLEQHDSEDTADTPDHGDRDRVIMVNSNRLQT